MEWLKDVSIIVAALTAILGISAWRRQLIGAKRVDLAERLLASFYEARDLIVAARRPTSFGKEGSTRTPRENEDPAIAGTLNAYWAPAERLFSKSEFFSALEALQYRAMAYFGAEIASSFVVLRGARNRVIIAAQMLVSYDRGESPVPSNLYQEWTEKLWDIGRADDETNRDLTACIATVEALCRPILSENGAGDVMFWAQRWWLRLRQLKRSLRHSN